MGKFIYVVSEYGNWDGDFCYTGAFETKEKAEEYYQKAIEDAKEQYSDYEEIQTSQGNYSFALWWADDVHYYHNIEINRIALQ